MIRWLQTTLFGGGDEPPVPPGPPAASASRTAAGTIDPALQARWTALAPDIALETPARLRQGWRIDWKRGHGGPHSVRLRAPAALRAAPDDILRAFAAWARLAVQRRSPARRAERLALEKRLHAWLDAHHAADVRTQRLKRGRAARKLDRLVTQGRHHDLQTIFEAVRAEYFRDVPELARARITWASRWGGLSTQTHAAAPDGGTYPLLTISRGYDHPSATPEIVGGVVYHECLHVVVPPEEPEQGRGRRVIHGREFRRREKQYRFYDAWRAWHAEKLPGIIRRGPKN